MVITQHHRPPGGASENAVPALMAQDSPKASQAEAAVTLVDIGGTKELILVVGVDKKGGLLADEVYARKEIPTPVGKVDFHYDQSVAAVRQVQEAAGRQIKILPLVCVGTPGRMVDGVIQPGSAANLGDMPHDFDGINPQEELQRRLGGRVSVVNDAIAQMGFGLEALFEAGLADRLRNRKVCYVGPGTGLGGGFSKVGGDLSLDIYTDGHIYDILIPGYDGKVSFKFECDGDSYSAQLPGDSAKAEDVFSGRAMRQMACAIDRELLQAGKEPMFLPLVEGASLKKALAELKLAAKGYGQLSSDEKLRLLAHDNDRSPVEARFLRERVLQSQSSDAGVLRAKDTAQKLFEFEGLMFGKLIERIYLGEVVKYSPQAQWPPADREKVKGTRDYIIGGSVGTRGEGGRMIQKKALEYLAERFKGVEFNLYPIDPSMVDTANAGALGTYMFADRAAVSAELGKLKKS
jgi:hypothetical protein